MSKLIAMSRSALKIASQKRVYAGVSGGDRLTMRRAQLIKAGIACFGRDGFAATTTRSLSAESGLSQRYFYESFSGIEEFFAQVVREKGEEIQAQIADAIKVAHGDANARLRAGLRAYFSGIRHQRHVGRLLLIEAFTASPTIAQVRRFLDHMADAIAAVLANDPSMPRQLTSPDLRLLCTGYVGAIHHIALPWVFDGFKEPVERMVDIAARLIMGSLRGQQVASRRGSS